MTKRLTTQNATITTAAVEMKTLTISGKQVTLAVFRQLLESPLVDWNTCQLRGVPWGWVNHHARNACPTVDADPFDHRAAREVVPHRHIVWQQGEMLRQSAVWTVRWDYEWIARERTMELNRKRIATGLPPLQQGVREWHEAMAEAEARNGLTRTLLELSQLFIAV